MWEFYLIMTEIGFRYGKQMVFQVQLMKAVDALPNTRDYYDRGRKHFTSPRKNPSPGIEQLDSGVPGVSVAPRLSNRL